MLKNIEMAKDKASKVLIKKGKKKKKMNQKKKKWFILKNKKKKVIKSNNLKKTISSLKSGDDIWSTRNKSLDIIFNTLKYI